MWYKWLHLCNVVHYVRSSASVTWWTMGPKITDFRRSPTPSHQPTSPAHPHHFTIMTSHRNHFVFTFCAFSTFPGGWSETALKHIYVKQVGEPYYLLFTYLRIHKRGDSAPAQCSAPHTSPDYHPEEIISVFLVVSKVTATYICSDAVQECMLVNCAFSVLCKSGRQMLPGNQSWSGDTFLAVQNSSIGELVSESLSEWFFILKLQSDHRDFWPLIHLIRVMGRHDLTEKYLPTYILFCTISWGDMTWPKNLPTYLPPKHPQEAILDTCDN